MDGVVLKKDAFVVDTILGQKISVSLGRLMLFAAVSILSGCLVTVSHFEGGSVSSDLGADCSFGCTYQLNEGESLNRIFLAQPAPGNDFVRWTDSLGDSYSICPRPTELECELTIAPIHPLFEGLELGIVAEFRVVTGYNANSVQFSTDLGPTGTFTQVDQTYWREEYPNRTPVNYYFVTARTQSNLVLFDEFKDIHYYIDLSAGTIRSQLGAAALDPWGSVVGSSAKPGGWLVSQVQYGRSNGTHKGDYIQIDEQTWGDRKRGKQAYKFIYQEVSRDESSVYLRDESRNIDIQLDLHTGRLYSSKAQAPKKEIGTIQRVLQPVNGFAASEILFSSESDDVSGAFTQTGADNWVERAAEGGAIVANFELSRRSVKQIILVDMQNDITVKIDIENEVITKGGTPLLVPTATYEITAVR